MDSEQVKANEHIIALVHELAEARKVIDFYVDTNNWKKQTQYSFGMIEKSDQWDGRFKVGGKRAREFLAKYKG